MTTFLIGAAIGVLFGASLVIGIILEGYKVTKKAEWEEEVLMMSAMRSRVNTLTAENANLQVALAAGEMTEEGKKVAAMTMAVLGAAISAEKVA